jgi:hypothetical protein
VHCESKAGIPPTALYPRTASSVGTRTVDVTADADVIRDPNGVFVVPAVLLHEGTSACVTSPSESAVVHTVIVCSFPTDFERPNHFKKKVYAFSGRKFITNAFPPNT